MCRKLSARFLRPLLKKGSAPEIDRANARLLGFINDLLQCAFILLRVDKVKLVEYAFADEHEPSASQGGRARKRDPSLRCEDRQPRRPVGELMDGG